MAGGNANSWRIQCCVENIKSFKEYREHRHKKHGEKVSSGVFFVEGVVREEVDGVSYSDGSDIDEETLASFDSEYNDGEVDDEVDAVDGGGGMAGVVQMVVDESDGVSAQEVIDGRSVNEILETYDCDDGMSDPGTAMDVFKDVADKMGTDDLGLLDREKELQIIQEHLLDAMPDIDDDDSDCEMVDIVQKTTPWEFSGNSTKVEVMDSEDEIGAIPLEQVNQVSNGEVVDSLRIRWINSDGSHFTLRKRKKREPLKRYLSELCLGFWRGVEIDDNGSCFYSSLYVSLLINGQLWTVEKEIYEMLDFNARYPLRDLCQQLLKMNPIGTKWEGIHEVHISQQEAAEEESENKKTTGKWEGLADGNRWADNVIIQLLAICLNVNIVIIEKQTSGELTVQAILSLDESNMKEPILLLLQEDHYTPLDELSGEGFWYKKMSGRSSLPWVSKKSQTVVSMTTGEPVDQKEGFEQVAETDVTAKMVGKVDEEDGVGPLSETMVLAVVTDSAGDQTEADFISDAAIKEKTERVYKFSCRECSLGYDEVADIYVHLRTTHRDLFVHQCRWCSFCSVIEENLVKHVKSHEVVKAGKKKKRVKRGRNNRTCDVCGRGYTLIEGLSRHIRDSHGGADGGAQRYTCKECGKTYANNSHLNKHFLNIHEHNGEKRFSCDSCTYRAVSADTLGKHKKRHGNGKKRI